jgi:hypothetical protein
MIELVHILRAIVEETAYGGVRGENLHQKKYAVPPIKLSELEQLVFDVLWQEKRIAIYATSWEMRRELERLADLGIIKYDGEVRIENPEEFLKKTEPFILVARNMISGNRYLKHVIQQIEDAAREYAAKNIKSRLALPAASAR